MDSLFSYRYGIIQIRVNDTWIEHAELHAQKVKEYKKNVKVSNWDISQRIGEIAVRFYLHKLGATSSIAGLEYGSRPVMPTTKQNLVVGVYCPPADERWNTGSNAGLSLFKRYVGEASLYIAALYDPPFVDFIGWADVQAILTQSEDQRGRVVIPATELRTMAELAAVLTQEKGK